MDGVFVAKQERNHKYQQLCLQPEHESDQLFGFDLETTEYMVKPLIQTSSKGKSFLLEDAKVIMR